jgi:hypothetical protein
VVTEDQGQDALATMADGGGIMPSQPKPKTGFVYDDIYLEHLTTPGHPESPARLTAIIEKLQDGGARNASMKRKPPAGTGSDDPRPNVWSERISCETGDEYLTRRMSPISHVVWRGSDGGRRLWPSTRSCKAKLPTHFVPFARRAITRWRIGRWAFASSITWPSARAMSNSNMDCRKF